MSSGADDVELVVGLESLFRAHYGRLVRALTLVAGDRDLAADAVQEAFLKAHLHWRRIRRYDDPVGWVRRVAINRLRDDHRRQRTARGTVERVAHNLREPTAEWSDGADAATMLSALPRQQRLAVALHYIGEMSVIEVAAAMRISEGAVKYHLHEGRRRLRGATTDTTRREDGL